MTFNDFNLTDWLKSTLAQMKFTTPTPIQEKSIPLIQTGQDFIGCASTGSGKTLAFALPLLNQIEVNKKRVVVLCPTRELAQQIEMVIKQVLRQRPSIRSVLVIGGTSMHRQVSELKQKPQIIIATPGRLADHLQQRTVHLQDVGAVVLDEADRMLDMGFAPQIERILRQVPENRQTILFSATFPKATEKLIQRIMRNPQKVVIGQSSIPLNDITQATLETTVQQKNNMLLDELNARQGSILIFTRTKSRTDRLFGYLADYGYSVSRIHGGRSQGQRTTAIKGFRENRYRIMVATDVAARGIDITDVAHVINYDLPQVPEDYVHRIGRTGRAGAKGHALTMLTPEDRGQWFEICKAAKLPLPPKPGKPQHPAAKPSQQGQSRHKSRPQQGRHAKSFAKKPHSRPTPPRFVRPV
ncbi:MAG: DEAD/DEAH box helicase [Bdellovibrionales bacterium]